MFGALHANVQLFEALVPIRDSKILWQVLTSYCLVCVGVFRTDLACGPDGVKWSSLFISRSEKAFRLHYTRFTADERPRAFLLAVRFLKTTADLV